MNIQTSPQSIVNSPRSIPTFWDSQWFICLPLLMIPLMGFSQGQVPSPHQLDASKVHFLKTAVTDSVSGQTRYHCQVKLSLPAPKAIRAVTVQVHRTSNNNQLRSARLSVTKGNFRRKRVGLIRKGKKVWLDFGTLNGNGNYTATVQLVDRKGRLTNAVVVQ